MQVKVQERPDGRLFTDKTCSKRLFRNDEIVMTMYISIRISASRSEQGQDRSATHPYCMVVRYDIDKRFLVA